MAKYTIELREIAESLAGNLESNSENYREIIEAARAKIFRHAYPVINATYKAALELKILMHYYFREIAYETTGRFLFELDKKMNEIMPYFNQRLAVTLDGIDPLVDFDLRKEYLREASVDETSDATANLDATNTATGENTATSETERDAAVTIDTLQGDSDTPQGQLTGVRELKYLSKAALVDGNNTEHSTDNKSDVQHTETENKTLSENVAHSTMAKTDTENTTETTKGRSGKSAAELIVAYRKAIINVDMEIIDALEPLFFGLF